VRVNSLGQVEEVMEFLRPGLKTVLKQSFQDLRPQLRDAMKKDVLPKVLLYVVGGLVASGISAALICHYMGQKKRRKR